MSKRKSVLDLNVEKTTANTRSGKVTTQFGLVEPEKISLIPGTQINAAGEHGGVFLQVRDYITKLPNPNLQLSELNRMQSYLNFPLIKGFKKKVVENLLKILDIK